MEDNSETFSVLDNKNNILFEGTNVVSTLPSNDGNDEVYGIVFRTGFTTLKGTLIKLIFL